jgi:hypothetical protein
MTLCLCGAITALYPAAGGELRKRPHDPDRVKHYEKPPPTEEKPPELHHHEDPCSHATHVELCKEKLQKFRDAFGSASD